MEPLRDNHHTLLLALRGRTMSRAELRAAINSSGSTLNKILKRLLDSGLVQMPSTDRHAGVSLTDKGREYAATLTLLELTVSN